jgi:hypothetical protein
MSEIMEMNCGQLGRAECVQQYPAPEVGVPQWLSGGAGEDEPFLALLGEARQAHLPHVAARSAFAS